LGKKEKYFEAIELTDKSLPVLLKLYFGQADACIVSEDNLNLAAEMNPQLATSFITLEVSKPILRSVLADRKSKSDENKKLLLDNLLNLDKSSEGKQILKLFRIDKLLPFKKEYLQNSCEIIQTKK
jgi:ABC-type phosphate/phosphonate transport system substrate-binding protein